MFPASKFIEHSVDSIAALDDGSVMVIGDGLYLISGRNRVDMLWPPRAQDFWYGLSPAREGAMALYRNEDVLGVREDGSLAFRFAVPGADRGHVDHLTLLEDRHDTIWMLASVNYVQALYSVNESTGHAKAATVNSVIARIFLDPKGEAYVALRDGTILLLNASSEPRARIFHEPVALESAPPGQFGTDGAWEVEGVGSDSSIWLSNFTTVAHVHPDGRIAYRRLIVPFTSWKTIPGAISLRVAPDGSAWAYAPEGFVRITDADAVQSVTVPRPMSGFAFPYAFAPDGSVWYVSHDLAVVHVCI
jgi:hypothetical protein